VYAGADGNVYRHTSDGWQKYDDGSWNSVTRPTQSTAPGGSGPQAANRPSSQSPGSPHQRSGQGGGPFAQRFANSEWGQQLDHDRFARTQGDERQQQFNQWREGGGEGFGNRFGGARAFGAGRFAGGFRR
jgi:hypothetical protein